MNGFPETPYVGKPLTDAEKAISYSKYYYLPLAEPNPDAKQLVNEGPMPEEKTIPVDRMLDLLLDEQGDAVVGYCQLANGSGYNTHYAHLPTLTMEMVNWWYSWLRMPTEGAAQENGNLKYRLWCPPDHSDYAVVRDKGGRDCIMIAESFDLGHGDKPSTCFRYPLTAEDIGLTKERVQGLKERGCVFNYSLTKSDDSACRINANFSRPHPAGGVEMRQCNWCGYGFENGKIYRDTSKPQATLEGMRKALIHNIVEIQHLGKILPMLFAEYHQ